MKYVISTLAFIILLAGSIFFVSQQSVTAGYDLSINDQQLTLTLLGPYGQKIAIYGKNLGDNSQFTQVSLEFNSHEVAKNTRYGINQYCGEGGGNYFVSYYLKVRNEHGPIIDEKRVYSPVYNCSTIKDLLSNVKIPQQWKTNDDTLLVYCSEPGKKNSNIENSLTISSFLFSDLNDVYTACLIRNEDTQESVLYGFPYGNKKLEKHIAPFVNESKQNPISIMSGYNLNSPFRINDNSQMMEFEKEISANTNEKIYLSFFNQTSKPYFILTQDSSYLLDLVSLSSVFNYNKVTDQTSRMVMMRKFENRTIYGFQTQEEAIGSYLLDPVEKSNNLNRDLNPMYIINYDGFGRTNQTCMDSLAAHEPTSNILDQSQTKVVCLPDTILLQPSNLNENSHTMDLGFTLFKNIITKANGAGPYIGSSYYDNSISVIYRSRESFYPTILPPPPPPPEPEENSGGGSSGGSSNNQGYTTQDYGYDSQQGAGYYGR